MMQWCRGLCKDPKNKKKDKKDKHGNKEDSKGKHKVKNVYTYSMTGQGKKNVEQDSASIFELIEDNTIVRFFGVYDGHGDFGKEASWLANLEIEQFVRKNIKKILKMRDQKDYKEKVKKMFKQCYADVQAKFNKSVIFNPKSLKSKYRRSNILKQSGTTGVSILQIDQELFILNVGDSRAIMCNVEGGEISAMELSTDHKPFNPIEKERIEKSGGEILIWTSGPLRVWKKDEESPGLAVTRTLGDLLGHKIGISSEPDIEYWKVMNDDYFLILASDGVWDVMNSAEVVGFVIKETDDMKKAAIQLVQAARSIWEYQNTLRRQAHMKNMFGKAIPLRGNQTEKVGAIDDITAVIVCLNPKIDKNSLSNQ